MYTKGCLGFALRVHVELFANIKKRLGFRTPTKTGLSITQDLKKMKTIPNKFL